MYSVSYVEDLERRTRSHAVLPKNDAYPASEHQRDEVHHEAESASTDLNPDSTTSPIIPEPSMSSSLNFGSQIRSLPTDPAVGTAVSSGLLNSTTDDVYELEKEGASKRSASSNIQWPTEDEAQDLLNTVLNSIGSLQHLIDPRSFSDKISMFYEGGTERKSIGDLCYVEILMVFALGGLLRGKPTKGSSFPGAEYFMEATNSLPSICTLRKAGGIAIEIMGLFAFFLQCSDRKEDAYVHAGIALRLAVSNGLARDTGIRHMQRSERTHRNRLWWTIYMQERRLSAATGNPVGILDDHITTKLPSESPGFPPTAALNLNIKLARLTGRIMQGVYDPKLKSEKQFLRTVHDLIAELTKVWREMPYEFAIDFSARFAITRASATLHLMLFQAMILASRPILLHLAKSKLEGNGLDLSSSSSPLSSGATSLQKLATICIEAAGMSLDVLRSLKQQALLATFGYFDLDATVSAAFVFVLVESLHTGSSTHSGRQGIRGAVEILQYFSSHGNKAADRRLLDVEQICQHLDISLETTTAPASPAAVVEESSIAPDSTVNNDATHSLPPVDITTEALLPHSVVPTEGGVDSDWREALIFSQDPHGLYDGLELGNFTVSDEAIFGNLSGFHLDFGDDFMLTGADETDWEEFERHITRHQESGG